MDTCTRESFLLRIKEAKDRGLFVCFEGLSGSGKTYHAKRMQEFLSAEFGDSNVFLNNEPSVLPIGRFIRLFIDGKISLISDELIEKVKNYFSLFKKINGYTYDVQVAELLFSLFSKFASKRFSDLIEKEIQLLFILDRFFDICECIAPRLEVGGIVVQDRYVLSTICYGSKTKEDRWFYMHAHEIILGEACLKPNVTFILSAPPDVCLKRLVDAGKILDRFENQKELSLISKQYDEVFKEKSEADNMLLIDSSVGPEETWEHIRKSLLAQKISGFF